MSKGDQLIALELSDRMSWLSYDEGDSHVVLDGHFTADDLKKIAAVLEQPE